MKLKLNYESGVAVLEVLEDVSRVNGEAFKAGLLGLLRDGRRRIVLDLEHAEGLSPDSSREILKAVELAVERGAHVALSGQSRALRSVLEPSAKPLLYSTRSAAIEAVRGTGLPADADELRKRLADAKAENDKLKARAAQAERPAELRELAELRRANGRLARELAGLRGAVSRLQAEPIPCAVAPALAKRIEAFERVLVHLLSRDGATP